MPLIHVKCQQCGAKHRVDASLGGLRGRCRQCSAWNAIPIPDPALLLAWAWQAPYSQLTKFVNHGGGHGHNRRTIDELVRIRERRRWLEEDKLRREMAADAESHRQAVRAMAAAPSAKSFERYQTLVQLRQLDPYAFERLVADLFAAEGYNARAVGGCADGGIDVEIRERATGKLWAVAQCKRYGAGHRVTPLQIRAFAGAYYASGAEYGYFVTTGTLTRHARSTARGFAWLTVYNGHLLEARIRHAIERNILQHPASHPSQPPQAQQSPQG